MSESSNASRRERIREDLKHSLEDHLFTKIERRLDEADTISGYVVAIGNEWVVVATQTDGRVPNGFELLRIKYISSVFTRGPEDSISRRVLETRGDWPPPSLDVNLDDTRELLRQLGEQFALLSFHLERRWPDMTWVGSVCSVDDTFLGYHAIDPQAVWDKEVDTFKLRRLTRITAGDDYQDSLLLVAEPGPGRRETGES